MEEMDKKLSDLVSKLRLSTGSLFGDSMIVKSGFLKEGDSVFEIRLPDKNNSFLISKRAMSILLAKDLFNLPGSNYMEAIENPVTRGIATFCNTYKNTDQKEFEEFGREVLLEGLKCNEFSMSLISDPFGLYILIRGDQIFRDDLGPNGLQKTGLFLRKYGRLPFPEEKLEQPNSLCLFKEKMTVPIGSWINIPGRQQWKLLVCGGILNNFPIHERIYFMKNDIKAPWKYQTFSSEEKTNWIHKISIADVSNCILSGIQENLLTTLAEIDPEVLSGKKIKIFGEILDKTYKHESIQIKRIPGKKIMRLVCGKVPDQFYAKGFMPFLLATGRFPTMQEIMDYNKTKTESQRGER